MKTAALALTAVIIALLVNPAGADEKALRKERQVAQQERQAQKNERARQINEATRSFREFSRELKQEYQELLRDFDTELKLKRVELKAEQDARTAVAEAEYRQKLMSLFTTGQPADEEAMQKLQADSKAYGDELFGLRRQFAEAAQRERIASEKRKHGLLDERDARALEEADALGLTRDYPPILASAIGESLTAQEESWNARERTEVARIKQRNLRTVAEFANGAELRAWQLRNLEEDFELKWQEQAELHEVNSQLSFYNMFTLQAAQGGELDQQQMMARVTELSKQTQLIRIKYNKTRQQNRIRRGEERRKLQGR